METTTIIADKIVKKIQADKKIKRNFSAISILTLIALYALSYFAFLLEGAWIYFLILLIFVVLLYAFLFKAYYPYLISPIYTNKEGIVLRLIQIAKRIDRYLEDPSLARNQLQLIKTQEYKTLKLKLRQSRSNYENAFAFETKNREFLNLLSEYLSINLRKVYSNQFRNSELAIFEEDLKNLSVQIYYGNFDAAEKIIKSKVSPSEVKKTSLDFLLSPIFISHLITLLIFAALFFAILDLYPVKGIQDINALFALLISVFVTYAVYSKIQSLILRAFEFIQGLCEPVNLNNNLEGY